MTAARKVTMGDRVRFVHHRYNATVNYIAFMITLSVILQIVWMIGLFRGGG